MRKLLLLLTALLMLSISGYAQQLPSINVCIANEMDTNIINSHPTVRSWIDGWDTLSTPPSSNNDNWYIKYRLPHWDSYYASATFQLDSLSWKGFMHGMYIPYNVRTGDTLELVYYKQSPVVAIDTVYFLVTTYKPVICLATTVSNQRNELLFDINHVTLGDTIDVFRDNDAIGTLVYDNTVTDLIYVDSSLNQNITKKYQYTASIRNSCRESWVNTIYLRYSGGNLVWNDYELDQDEGVIDGYSVYKISNGVTDSIYRMERGVDDVNGIYEFTDLAYVPGDTYFVTAVKTDGCVTSKTGNGVITSNKVTVGAVGISEVGTIDQKFLVLGQHPGKLLVISLEPVMDITILNLNGQIVGQKVASSGTNEFNLPSGIYFITDGFTTKKAVVY